MAVTWFLALVVLLGLAVAAVAIVLVSARRRGPDPRGFEVIDRHEPK